MTLEQLFQDNGGTIGFRVRSVKTNNVLEVIARTPKGKFVLQSITTPDAEEAIAKGDLDRYTPVLDETVIENLKTSRAEVQARLVELDQTISTLEDERFELEGTLEAILLQIGDEEGEENFNG